MATTKQAPAARQRRRGPVLEAAILEAAWDELAEVGFAHLTMESVSVRARTGIAVLYRRWANKDELVLAALQRYRDTHLTAEPDTGTLRGDLIAALTSMGEARLFVPVGTAAVFSGLLASTGLTFAEVRDRIFGPQRMRRMRGIYERAHARGEIDLEQIPEAALAMPFDLVRHDLFVDVKPVPLTRIHAIVDELFLPLVRHR